MPAPNPPHDSRLTCNNGLTLTVRHEPRLKHSAAYLRVAAGSHDVPAAWPGLAHFLEHLLFLGTDRFPPAQGLMAYVLAAVILIITLIQLRLFRRGGVEAH